MIFSTYITWVNHYSDHVHGFIIHVCKFIHLYIIVPWPIQYMFV